MNKKVLLAALAVLALIILPISPAMADITRDPYYFQQTYQATMDDGRVWTTEGGISQTMGRIVERRWSGTLGVGTEVAEYRHITRNVETGEGIVQVWGVQTVTIPSADAAAHGVQAGDTIWFTGEAKYGAWGMEGRGVMNKGTGGLSGVKVFFITFAPPSPAIREGTIVWP